VHLSELKLPEGVELTALTEENDPAITTIAKPKVQKADEPVEASEEAGRRCMHLMLPHHQKLLMRVLMKNQKKSKIKFFK
jgi:hypothetical protein